jgi:hydrogenase maturation protein HypF
MELEFAIGSEETDQAYPFEISDYTDPQDPDTQAPVIVDWEPFVRGILRDVQDGIPPPKISRKFHNTLVEVIVAVARRVSKKRVVLTGGCFQNKFLLEHAVEKLEQEGFRPYWHQRIPPNDGGISLGQIVAASRILRGLEP